MIETIYYIPYPIWEAVGFGLKVLFLGFVIVGVIIAVTKELSNKENKEE